MFSVLRYLAMGSSLTALGFQFMRGKRTIFGIIADTTSAIWLTLQPLFMPPPNESKWKCTAEQYRYKMLS
jgi:hypothetical protein